MSFWNPYSCKPHKTKRFFGIFFILSLVAFGVNASKASSSELHRAANEGDVIKIKKLIAEGANVNGLLLSVTPLHMVSAMGDHVDAAKLLISEGANVNAQDMNGFTPLLATVTANAEGVVEVLIKSGADVNLGTRKGSTPLIEAAWHGNTRIGQMLIEAGANLNASVNGKTPLEIAKSYGHQEFFQMLINNGAKSTLNSKESQGEQSYQTPKDTHLHFRKLVLSKQYDKAFGLLDANAKAEFKTTTTALLGMMGIATSKLRSVSDFELFQIFMSNQTPHEYQFVYEKINKDIAVIHGQIRQGSATQPIKITLKKISGKWFIHSTGVAFGQ